MRAVGLITEYNPFHNGHLHHLQQSLRLAEAEVAVAVMSGHFLQRGEPALFDKWTRAEMALRAGVDLVVELPYPWACNSAPWFARGAVQALNALGGIDALCFGSEAGELAPLQSCAELLLQREVELDHATAKLLRQGLTYPSAREQLVADWSGDAGLTRVFASPNNILGIAYLKALTATGSAMLPLTIPRKSAGYHDPHPGQEGIASATALRRLLASNQTIAEYIPHAILPLLTDALAQGVVADDTHLHRLLQGRIFRGAESLRSLYLVEDGIEQRLFAAALRSDSLSALVDGVKSRQLTRTRVQRLLCHLLNEASAKEMVASLAGGPLYLHLLAAGPRGRDFLAASRKRRTLPMLSNYSRALSQLKRHYGAATASFELARRQLELELRASRNYTLLQRRWQGGERNRDFFEDVRTLEGYN